MIIINLVLIFIFLINYFAYWIIIIKTNYNNKKSWNTYKKIYLVLWIIPVITLPIINSSLFSQWNGQESYFKELWIWFLILGIIFIGVGIKLGVMYINKREFIEKGEVKLNIKGVYEIMRHPMYADWALTFIGLSFIFDSLIGLIIAPIFLLFLELQAFLEEKYIFIPKYGNKRIESYKKKTPYKLFPTPYNALLLIIAIFVIYIGFLNFFVSP
ncbi:MAG: hypothetical protein EU535_00235 [Promethearchaeota archaeon]|nr:MAG: hypothetical protein EU535_00235 [Candidatus Lokiarchaeota archaeon]